MSNLEKYFTSEKPRFNKGRSNSGTLIVEVTQMIMETERHLFCIEDMEVQNVPGRDYRKGILRNCAVQ